MWSEGDALAYSSPAVLGAGGYGVAMAVTTPDARRIAVKLIPKRTNFASTSDGRIAFAGRELAVIGKMKDAGARHVMVYNRGFEHKGLFEDCRRDGETAAKRNLQKLILENFQHLLHWGPPHPGRDKAPIDWTLESCHWRQASYSELTHFLSFSPSQVSYFFMFGTLG